MCFGLRLVESTFYILFYITKTIATQNKTFKERKRQTDREREPIMTCLKEQNREEEDQDGGRLNTKPSAPTPPPPPKKATDIESEMRPAKYRTTKWKSWFRL